MSLNALKQFYNKHKVRYYVANYQYQQAHKRSQDKVHVFALQLARLIQQKALIVYTDESSFNLWLHQKRTWFNVEQPVKIILNKYRGTGITVYGAISEQLNKPLFSTGKGTTSEDFSKFLKKIRGAFPYNRGRKIYLVLDNAMAHHTTNVTNMAASQKIELMFLPPYTPELNPIEALWGIVKRDFKNRMANCKSITL